MQRIKELLTADDAVSPVIGVILMVAITVILAAVIAAFVLGIGDTDDVAPQTTFDSSVDGEEIVFEVVSGDAIEIDEFEIRGANDDALTDSNWAAVCGGGGDPTAEGVALEDCLGSNTNVGAGETANVGQSFTIGDFGGDEDGTAEANLVWVADGEDIVKEIDVSF